MHNDLNDGCMKLVLVTHRGCTTLQIREIRAFIGYQKRALELAGITCVDTEIGA